MVTSAAIEQGGLQATGITFPVADVVATRQPLAEATYREAVDHFLVAGCLTDGQVIHPAAENLLSTASLVAGVLGHPFLAALRLAYAKHHPIAISPDMVWLLICQGVAHHLRLNAERLRPVLVRHPGRLTLEIELDGGRSPGSDLATIPWPDVLAAISTRIRDHIGPRLDLFSPSFSTTGPVERVAAQVVLFGAVDGFFHQRLTDFVCGIPAVTLEGSLADWEQVVDRVDGFADLSLEWWLEPLRGVLREFVGAASGIPNQAFWRSIYRMDGACSPDGSSSGWISVLFPYLADERGSATKPNPVLTGGRPLLDPGMPALRDRDFPGGVVRTPLTWIRRGPAGEFLRRWDLELFGGFLGVTQQHPTLRLRPEIAWAVCTSSRASDGPAESSET